MSYASSLKEEEKRAREQAARQAIAKRDKDIKSARLVQQRAMEYRRALGFHDGENLKRDLTIKIHTTPTFDHDVEFGDFGYFLGAGHLYKDGSYRYMAGDTWTRNKDGSLGDRIVCAWTTTKICMLEFELYTLESKESKGWGYDWKYKCDHDWITWADDGLNRGDCIFARFIRFRCANGYDVELSGHGPMNLWNTIVDSEIVLVPEAWHGLIIQQILKNWPH